MSHWVQLAYDGNIAEVEAHEEGGTFALGGTPSAELNVTYNYGPLIRMAAEAVGWDLLTKSMAQEDDDKEQTLNKFDLLFHVYAFAEDGIRALDGKTGKETASILRSIQGRLGTNQHEDYWAPTPGNAGHALMILADWAEQHPDAVWSVS